ncbi:MAG: iron ABC transporter permease [Dehalococcoidia bacterium]|nr:iron ABC transporter permease [Dehalococcoidia bacterium]
MAEPALAVKGATRRFALPLLGGVTVSGTALLVLLAFLTVFPLLMIVYGSFVQAGPLARPVVLTLQGYLSTYTELSTYGLFGTTLWLTAARTALVMALAVFFAWAVARTDTPLRRVIEPLMWLVFFIPPQSMIYAWIILLAPKTGLINVALMSVLPFKEPPFSIYSHGGIIWVSVLLWTSVAFILITPAFKRMDRTLEEAARICGVTVPKVLMRITLPLLRPAILGATVLVFVRLMGSFEIELFLGNPANIYVFSTKIYDYLSMYPTNYPAAMALSVGVQVLTLVLVAAQWKLVGGREYTVITGRGYSASSIRLGHWKYVTLAVMLVYIFFAVLLPLGALVLGSISKVVGVYGADLWTLANYQDTFQNPAVWSSFQNTFVVSVVAATLGIVLYSLISYTALRTRFAGRRLLDLFSWIPYAVPGVVLSLGFLWAFVGVLPFAPILYGSLYLMIMVAIIRALPLGVRTMNGSLVQISRELEESAKVHGASWLYTFRRIIVPLVAPAFAASWILVFVFVWRELETFILLYLPKSRLVPIMMFEYWQGGRVGNSVAIGVVAVAVAFACSVIAWRVGIGKESGLST